MKRTHMIFGCLAAVCISLLSAGYTGAATPLQSAQPDSETYSWHAELVSLDESAGTITVKARVVGEEAMAAFGKFKAGERVALTWSGFTDYADAIYRAARYDSARKAGERFMFPAEFVSFDTVRHYVTFKAPIPESNVATIKSMKPGEWVTASSPHGAPGQTQPIVRVRPYGAPSGAGAKGAVSN